MIIINAWYLKVGIDGFEWGEQGRDIAFREEASLLHLVTYLQFLFLWTRVGESNFWKCVYWSFSDGGGRGIGRAWAYRSMKITFVPEAWYDYLFWQKNDNKLLNKVNQLIKDITRNPFKGLGKPEALKY